MLVFGLFTILHRKRNKNENIHEFILIVSDNVNNIAFLTVYNSYLSLTFWYAPHVVGPDMKLF